MNCKQLTIPAATLVCLALGTLALTQNRNTLQERYGSPVNNVYRTTEGFLIEPTFAPNNNLCAAHIRAESRKMKDAELEPLLEEIAPKNTRGEFVHSTFLDYTCLETDKVGSFTGAAYGCGGVTDDYERFSITKWGNTNDYKAADVTYYQKGCKNKKPRRKR